MPIPADPNAELEKGARATLPPPIPDESPSAGDILGAAFKTSNTIGSLYDYLNHPPPNPVTKPGFDPAVSIPKGYEGNAEQFAEARSPEDMEAVRQQIDRQRQSQQIIAGAGLWGVGAEMAAGAVDPVTIASMFVPVAGETRLARMAAHAAVGGFTALTQEAGLQATQPGRMTEESIQNVASTAVLSGVLGAFIRPHVPKKEFEAVADQVHADLHTGSEEALGPIDGRQRIIPETEVKAPPIAEEHPKFANARYIASQAGEHLASQEADLTAAAGGKEAEAVNLRGDDKEVFQKLDEAQKALNESSDFLMQDRATQVTQEAKNFARRDQINDYAIQRAREAGVPEQIHPDVQARAEESMDLQRANAQKVADLSRKSLASLQEDADRIRRVRGAESDLQLHQTAIKGAKSLDEALEALPEPLRERYRRQLGENETPAGTLDVQGHPLIPDKATTPEPILPSVPTAISEPLHVNPTAESTSGAAAVTTPTMRGESIARGAQTLAGTLGQVSPGARLMTSKSLIARQIIQHLANIPEMLTKNFSGEATASPIERELWKYEGIHWQGRQARTTQFKAYRERLAATGTPAMSRKAFDEQIAKAMRRSDTHDIPEVAQAAKDTRRIIFDPLKARAIKQGLLPVDVKPEGADSYLMRQYDAQKIKGNLSGWLDTLTNGFREQGVEAAEARDIAHAASRNVLGSERGTMDWHTMDGVGQSGQLKERTLKLPDHLLEPYLSNDIDRLSHSYLRSMAPEVEMTERFGSRDLMPKEGAVEGEQPFAPNLQDLKDDYARMIERAGSDKEKEWLYKSMEHDLRDLTAVRDRLYGIYGQPKDPGHFMVRAGRLLRSENALRLLGAATLAHFPDVANMMMRYGMANTFAAVGKVLTSPEAFNLGRNEAKRMGAALDMTMNATASILGDYAQHSQYVEQRIANGLTSTFTMLTGETPLITAVQGLTSTMAQDTMIRTAQKIAAGQSVDKNLLARMAAAGIDESMLKRIADQHEQFGAKVNGLNFGMSDKWTDTAAASAFESAVLRDAHSVTLRPGVGDTPLFMSTEWGKALRQFTTFGYAAQRGVVNPLMQGLAHGDPRAMSAMFALASMGTLSYVSKQTAAGQPIEDFNSARFALEVLDKSNLMGWTSDVVFPALWMMGFSNLSRWSDRDPVETIGGPVVGTVLSTYGKQLPAKFIGSAESALGEDEPQPGVNRSDLHFMRRLLPGQNLWFARSHINDLEDAIGNAFDLAGKSNADRTAERQSALAMN